MNLPAVFVMLSLLILHFVHKMICLIAEDAVHIILCVMAGKASFVEETQIGICNLEKRPSLSTKLESIGIVELLCNRQ